MKSIKKGAILFTLLSTNLFASSGAIPTPPSEDQITSSQDMLTVLKNILKDEVMPIALPVIEIILVLYVIWTLITGFQDSKKSGDWGIFKTNMIYAGVAVSIGMALAYFAQTISNSM